MNSVSGMPAWKSLVQDLQQGKSLYQELTEKYSINGKLEVKRFLNDLCAAEKNKEQFELKTIKFDLGNRNIPFVNTVYEYARKIVLPSVKPAIFMRLKPREMEDVIEKTTYLINAVGKGDAYYSNEYAKFVSELQPSDRKEVIDRIVPNLQSFMRTAYSLESIHIQYFLKVISFFPPEQRAIIPLELLKEIEKRVYQGCVKGYANHIISLLNGLHGRKTIEFFRGLCSIIHHISCNYHWDSIREALDHEKNACDVIAKAGPLLTTENSHGGEFCLKVDVLWFLRFIPIEQMTSNLIQCAMDLIHAIWDATASEYHKATGVGLSKEVKKRLESWINIIIPLEERGEIIEKIAPHLVHFRGSPHINDFIDIVKNIPQRDRTKGNLDKIIALRLTELGWGHDLKGYNMLGTVNDLFQHGVDMDVISRSLPYLEYYKTPNDMLNFITAVKKIPAEERQDILEVLHRHILENTQQISEIMGILNQIPKEERTDSLIHGLRDLFKVCKANQCLLRLGINLIPLTERRDVLEKLFSILPYLKRNNYADMIHILDVIRLLPRKDRKREVIRAIPSLFPRQVENGETNKEAIIRCADAIPEEYRAYAILRARPYLTVSSVNVRAAVLYACGQERDIEPFQNPPPELDEIIYPEERIIAQFFLIFMRPQQRTDEAMKILVTNLNDYESPGLLKAMKLFSLLPKETAFSTVTYLLNAIFYDIPNTKERVLNFLKWFGLENLNELQEELCKHQVDLINFNRQTFFEFFHIPKVREAYYKHAQHLLESDLASDQKLQIANEIVEHIHELLLHEEHELVQLAFMTISICDSAAMQNPKNPYRVFNTIKEALKTEKGIDVGTPSEEIAGQIVQLDIKNLREKCLWTGYKAKDLPPGIGINTIKELFEDFDASFSGLSDEEEKAVNDEIQTCFGHELSVLKQNLTDKPFIKSLLNRPMNPEESISETQFQLFALLRAVLDESDTVPENETLSPREYLLLKVSTSIQNCSTGQRDNLANYYNALPDKYKRGPRAEEGAEAEVKAFVDNCVQKALNGLLSNTTFLNELIGDSTMYQLSHVSEFLRNRFHLQIGLKHQVSFDPHTGVLPDALLAKQPEAVILCFFHHCTPSTFVRQVISGSEDMLKANKFMGIDALIKRIEGPTADYIPYYVFDDDTMVPLRLTERGAIALLRSSGYFIPYLTFRAVC